MSEMEEILNHAGKLGEAIAAHERCEAIKRTAKALKDDGEAKQLEQEYAEAATVLQEKAAAGKPLEPDEKRREADLRSKMAAHPVIRDFLKAQADFAELMQKTNATLEDAIGLE